MTELLLLAAIVVVAIWWYGKKQVGAHTPVTHDRSRMRIGGTDYPTPAFLLTAHNVFNRKLHVRHGKTLVTANAQPDTPAGRGKMLLVMLHSARAERLRRGYIDRDKLNQPVMPGAIPDGIIIEEDTGANGMRVAIVAYDLAEPLSLDDYNEASEHGIGHHADVWSRDDYWGMDKLPAGWMPLCYLQLKSVTLEASTPSLQTIKPDMPDAWR